jgi:sedoheptulose-bisphosphatase
VTDEEEEMLAIDLLAEEVLFDALSATGHVAVASSESDKVYRHLTLLPPPADDDHHEDMGPPPPPMYSVALDPLDSCSIIDANFAVGTIFGVWETTSLVNVTGRQLVAAGACTYGPRTAITLALDGRPDVYEFLLINEQWRLSNTYANIGEGKLFAPGNLRATACNPGYARLVEYWQSSQYTLRYTGGLVPDVTQLLVKGKGIFVSAREANERPPLRLLYEAIPRDFLIEKAGGCSSDGTRSLLDIEVRESDARTQVALGSAGEVARFEEMVGPG